MRTNSLKIGLLVVVGTIGFFGCSGGQDNGMLKCSNETALQIIQQKYENISANYIDRLQRRGITLENADEWRYNVAKDENEDKVSDFLDLPENKRYSTRVVEKMELNFSDFFTTAIDKDIRKRSCGAYVSGTLSLGKYGSVIINNYFINYSLQPSDDDEKVFVWTQGL